MTKKWLNFHLSESWYENLINHFFNSGQWKKNVARRCWAPSSSIPVEYYINVRCHGNPSNAKAIVFFSLLMLCNSKRLLFFNDDWWCYPFDACHTLFFWSTSFMQNMSIRRMHFNKNDNNKCIILFLNMDLRTVNCWPQSNFVLRLWRREMRPTSCHHLLCVCREMRCSVGKYCALQINS